MKRKMYLTAHARKRLEQRAGLFNLNFREVQILMSECRKSTRKERIFASKRKREQSVVVHDGLGLMFIVKGRAIVTVIPFDNESIKDKIKAIRFRKKSGNVQ